MWYPFFRFQLQCCGINGVNDYMGSNIPYSCCIPRHRSCPKKEAAFKVVSDSWRHQYVYESVISFLLAVVYYSWQNSGDGIIYLSYSASVHRVETVIYHSISSISWALPWCASYQYRLSYLYQIRHLWLVKQVQSLAKVCALWQHPSLLTTKPSNVRVCVCDSLLMIMFSFWLTFLNRPLLQLFLWAKLINYHITMITIFQFCYREFGLTVNIIYFGRFDFWIRDCGTVI